MELIQVELQELIRIDPLVATTAPTQEIERTIQVADLPDQLHVLLTQHQEAIEAVALLIEAPLDLLAAEA